MGKIIIFILLFFTLLININFISCNSKNMAQTSAVETQNTEQVISIKSETVKESSIKTYLLANGSIESTNTVEVFSPISGKVIRTYVELGTSVKKGDVIATIDPSTPGNIYLPSSVISPITGNIISIPLKTGTQVNVSSVITSIGNLSSLQLCTQIPERYFALLKSGLKAEFFAEAYPKEIFIATVKNVSPVIDATSRTSEVILSLNESNIKVTAGMYVKIKLYLSTKNNIFTVPESAVFFRSNEKFVYVEKDGIAQMRIVQTGVSSDELKLV